MAVAEICRKGGFSDATFYKWRAKFGGMEVSEARRLRELALGVLPDGTRDILALRNITKDWGRAGHNWKAAMNQFAILYEERFTKGVA